MATEIEIALEGAGGEPVHFVRTIMSHGIADLPPARVDEEARSYTTTLALPSGPPRTILITEGRRGFARVSIAGRKPSARTVGDLADAVRQILNLDEDLSEFYAFVDDDPDLSWTASGAGRMLRAPTVYEAVVKTICTTNCAWSATVRMTTALVEHLGEPAVGSDRHAFPTPEAMAVARERFYRDVVRAGYRGAYLRQLARDVASGRLDLEELGDPALPDDEVAERLLALPGAGPYATAHMMMLLGRYSRLILDSWSRPKYAKVSGRKATDKMIERRFRQYGRYAGLAFWLYITRDWVEDEPVGIK